MKGLFSKIRISRKIVLAFGGVLVLCGATGAAAVFIGADKILGPSYAELNGLECTEVQTVQIKKKDRFWIRKYISTNEPGDGISRVKTALRVAGAVYEKDKPDLVQVVVLDKSGPTDRSAMRGRAVGADVIYIPDPSRVPEGSTGQVFTARYVDKPANADGLFYGEKISLEETDIQALVARLDDKTDCVKPEVVVPEGHGAADGHGAKDAHGAPAEHGASGEHGAPAEHGAEDAHGASDGHGDAPAEGHGAEAPAEGHGEEATAGAHGEAAAGGESKGWFASLTGMVFGSEEAPAADSGHGADAGHGEAAPAGDHGAAPAEGHDGAPAADHGAAPEGEHATPAAEGEGTPSHGDAAPAEAGSHGAAAHDEQPAAEHAAEGEKAAAHGGGDHDAAPAPAGEAHDAAAAPEAGAAEGEGWFSSLKSMVLGGEEAAPAAEDHAAPAAETPAKAEEQSHTPSAEHDAAPAEEAQVPAEEHAAPADEHAAPTDAAAAEDHGDASATESHDGAPAAEGKAKQAGAAWLEKLRAKPLEGASAAPAVPDVPAEDADVLPPKASDKAAGDEHADATH